MLLVCWWSSLSSSWVTEKGFRFHWAPHWRLCQLSLLIDWIRLSLPICSESLISHMILASLKNSEHSQLLSSRSLHTYLHEYSQSIILLKWQMQSPLGCVSYSCHKYDPSTWAAQSSSCSEAADSSCPKSSLTRMLGHIPHICQFLTNLSWGAWTPNTFPKVFGGNCWDLEYHCWSQKALHYFTYDC